MKNKAGNKKAAIVSSRLSQKVRYRKEAQMHSQRNGRRKINKKWEGKKKGNGRVWFFFYTSSGNSLALHSGAAGVLGR